MSQKGGTPRGDPPKELKLSRRQCHEQRDVGLTQAQSRWTQAAWQCPELCGKPQTAGKDSGHRTAFSAHVLPCLALTPPFWSPCPFCSGVQFNDAVLVEHLLHGLVAQPGRP